MKLVMVLLQIGSLECIDIAKKKNIDTKDMGKSVIKFTEDDVIKFTIAERSEQCYKKYSSKIRQVLIEFTSV